MAKCPKSSQALIPVFVCDECNNILNDCFQNLISVQFLNHDKYYSKNSHLESMQVNLLRFIFVFCCQND